MIFEIENAAVNTVSHLIQLSVAPVFLIAGVGAILGVLSQRLARIIDRVERLNTKLSQTIQEETRGRRASDLTAEASTALKQERHYLHIRARNMNTAILFCIMTGLLVASVIMVLFLSSFFVFDGGLLIAGLFIFGMGAFMVSLSLFIREIFMATYFMKRIQEK
ncbi:MAG TPA: DUF2721 domain-containing protein [Thiomicrospira sp.]|jgi:MFS family permease|nr:DUF2721 domain-containing protein [Thiomicrospira sp.]